MNRLKRVGVLGEAMGELFTESSRRMMVGMGGDTFNAAVYMAQQHAPVQPHFFSAIGTDPFSQLFLAECLEFGVQSDSVLIDQERSMGLYSITNDAYGERHFNYWRDNSAAKAYLNDLPTSAGLSQWTACDSLFLSGITLAVMSPQARRAVVDAMKQYRNGATYFDDNYRPLLWGETAQQWYKEMFEASDYLLLSVEDQLAIHQLSSKETLVDMLSDYPEQTIILRNADQPMSIGHRHEWIDLDVEPVKPVDTTAAGDSFTGTFIALVEMGISTVEAAIHAAKVSAYVIQKPGALVQLPTALRSMNQ